MSIVWHTRQGHRRVEQIISDGHPVFYVRDPRTRFQAPDAVGFVPIFTRTIEVEGTKQTVFGQVTVAGLRVLGVELADLVTDAPEIPRRPERVLPRVAPDQRYHVFITEITADIAAAKARGEQP